MDVIKLPEDGDIPAIEIKEYFPFDTPYPNQLEAAWWAIEGLKSYDTVLISAPTGTGKSAIAYTICNYWLKTKRWYSHITTYRKALQHQYHKEFKIPIMYGRNNFYCLARDDICDKCIRRMVCIDNVCTVDNAPCSKQKNFICPIKKECPYL